MPDGETSRRALEIERIFRQEYGRAVSVLIRDFKDIDLAEDGVQDAFTVATVRWREQGPPPSPAGWIITTARRRVLDRLRREGSRADRQAEATTLHAPAEDIEEEAAVPDDRLRLMFTCCHPALAPAAQVALDAASPGRPLDLRDRPRVRRPRADHGAAHRPGQGQDP